MSQDVTAESPLEFITPPGIMEMLQSLTHDVRTLLQNPKREPEVYPQNQASSAQNSATISQVIEGYLANRVDSKEWSTATTIINTCYLHRVIQHVGDKPFTRETIARYFLSLESLDKVSDHYGAKAGAHSQRKPNERSATSIYNHKRVLKACSRWAYQSQIISHDPFSGINSLKVERPKTMRMVYSEADVIKLLTCTPESVGKPGRKTTRQQWMLDGPLSREHEQSRLLVLVLLDTAGRASEICQLTCGHVRQHEIHILGKNRKPGRLFISPVVHELLRAFAGDRPDHEPLFRNYRGGRCTKTSLLGIMRRLAKRAKIQLPADPLHSFRHFVARHWNEEGVPINIIQEFLRHANPATTRIYLDQDSGKVAKFHQDHALAEVYLSRTNLIE